MLIVHHLGRNLGLIAYRYIVSICGRPYSSPHEELSKPFPQIRKFQTQYWNQHAISLNQLKRWTATITFAIILAIDRYLKTKRLEHTAKSKEPYVNLRAAIIVMQNPLESNCSKTNTSAYQCVLIIHHYQIVNYMHNYQKRYTQICFRNLNTLYMKNES